MIILSAAVLMVTVLLSRNARRGTEDTPITWAEVQATISRRFPTVREIETAELSAWLRDPDRPPPLIIDVRSRAEFEVSHLPAAIHAEHVEQILSLLGPSGAKRPAVVYCSVGWRSAVIADALQQIGRTDVQNLRGSIFKWANEGRPLMSEGAAVETVHPYDHRWGALLAPERWPKESWASP